MLICVVSPQQSILCSDKVKSWAMMCLLYDSPVTVSVFSMVIHTVHSGLGASQVVNVLCDICSKVAFVHFFLHTVLQNCLILHESGDNALGT